MDSKMNERIKKLAKQADIYSDKHAESRDYVVLRDQYFAELIQKDMVEQCRDMFMVNSVSWNLLNEKLEHFGVGSSPNG